MSRNEGDAVIQLLIDTGVLTPNDASQIHTVHAEAIIHHMKMRDALEATDETSAREALAVLLTGGPLASHLEAKLKLVSIITGNVHRRLDLQRTRTHAQKERITGEAFPMIARQLTKPAK